jgi:hypothetical protein
MATQVTASHGWTVWFSLLCALQELRLRGRFLIVLVKLLNAVRSCTQLPTVAHSSCVCVGGSEGGNRPPIRQHPHAKRKRGLHDQLDVLAANPAHTSSPALLPVMWHMLERCPGQLI